MLLHKDKSSLSSSCTLFRYAYIKKCKKKAATCTITILTLGIKKLNKKLSFRQKPFQIFTWLNCAKIWLDFEEVPLTFSRDTGMCEGYSSSIKQRK